MVFLANVLFRASNCIEVIQLICEGGITAAGGWCGLVVCDGLDSLSHVPSVSRVLKVAVDFLAVFTLGCPAAMG